MGNIHISHRCTWKLECLGWMENRKMVECTITIQTMNVIRPNIFFCWRMTRGFHPGRQKSEIKTCTTSTAWHTKQQLVYLVRYIPNRVDVFLLLFCWFFVTVGSSSASMSRQNAFCAYVNFVHAFLVGILRFHSSRWSLGGVAVHAIRWAFINGGAHKIWL